MKILVSLAINLLNFHDLFSRSYLQHWV